MHDRSITLLKSYIAAQKQFIDDTTGLVTPYTKEESRRTVLDYEVAIAALKADVAGINKRLRDTLVGLVGSDDEEQLREMRRIFDILPAKNKMQQPIRVALDVLLETM